MNCDKSTENMEKYGKPNREGQTATVIRIGQKEENRKEAKPETRSGSWQEVAKSDDPEVA